MRKFYDAAPLRSGGIDELEAKQSDIQFGEWQKCPKCDGQGQVSKPPYVAGDVTHWVSSSVAFVCDVCNGAKIIQRPIINISEVTL